jgi:hypothetical protein
VLVAVTVASSLAEPEELLELPLSAPEVLLAPPSDPASVELP